jgi:hypothetical protein
VPSELFGVCVGTRGNVFAVVDAEHEFAIMSVSKPFVFALVCSPRSTSSPADVGLAQRTKLMPALDIFSSSAFSMVALTDAINKMPYVPGRIGQLGLFREQGVSTTSVMIGEREGSLNLVETTARGAPAIQNTTNKRKAHSLVVPHIALEDTILADEVQNVRAFGSENMLEGVQAIVNQALAATPRTLAGAPAIKTATLTVTVDYETSAPLS